MLELRAADLRQRAMLEDYLKDLPLAAGARILEIGCERAQSPAHW